jgi:hypothetical protein
MGIVPFIIYSGRAAHAPDPDQKDKPLCGQRNPNQYYPLRISERFVTCKNCLKMRAENERSKAGE